MGLSHTTDIRNTVATGMPVMQDPPAATANRIIQVIMDVAAGPLITKAASTAAMERLLDGLIHGTHVVAESLMITGTRSAVIQWVAVL